MISLDLVTLHPGTISSHQILCVIINQPVAATIAHGLDKKFKSESRIIVVT
jgi:molecular chaperone DnaK (HSP70)